MEQCGQYKGKIEDILKSSDLATITTKSVRRALESQLGISLNDVKKEINLYIEQLFLDFQEERKSKALEKKVEIKKVAGNKVTKKTTKKTAKKETKERKPIEWPLLKILPPLSDIIRTQLCSRPQTVKKMWEYIRLHNLQLETDKRVIICDDKFKELSGGEERITAFSMNKYTQKFFVPIPKEEQEKYKAILRQQEENKSNAV
ncbi:SWIB/MDM2 domain-containing protein [Helicostylum pulchrum]|nr:SWIB/MDM2 domain-containing protein [Helicostylum pulchrum]